MKTQIDLNNKSILVTGSPVFFGANLVIRLLSDLSGGHIVSLDNMNDYYNPTLKEWRLNQIKEKERNNPVKHSFVRGDLSDKELIDSLFSTYHFDVVANLAAQAGVRYYSNLQKNQQYPQDWNQPLQSSAMTRLRAA